MPTIERVANNYWALLRPPYLGAVWKIRGVLPESQLREFDVCVGGYLDAIKL